MEPPTEDISIEVIAMRFDVADGGEWRPDAALKTRGVSRLFWTPPLDGGALKRSYGRLLAQQTRADGQRELTFQHERSHVVTVLVYDGPLLAAAD